MRTGDPNGERHVADVESAENDCWYSRLVESHPVPVDDHGRPLWAQSSDESLAAGVVETFRSEGLDLDHAAVGICWLATRLTGALGADGTIELVGEASEAFRKQHLPAMGVPYQRVPTAQWVATFTRNVSTDPRIAAETLSVLADSRDSRWNGVVSEITRADGLADESRLLEALEAAGLGVVQEDGSVNTIALLALVAAVTVRALQRLADPLEVELGMLHGVLTRLSDHGHGFLESLRRQLPAIVLLAPDGTATALPKVTAEIASTVLDSLGNPGKVSDDIELIARAAEGFQQCGLVVEPEVEGAAAVTSAFHLSLAASRVSNAAMHSMLAAGLAHEKELPACWDAIAPVLRSMATASEADDAILNDLLRLAGPDDLTESLKVVRQRAASLIEGAEAAPDDLTALWRLTTTPEPHRVDMAAWMTANPEPDLAMLAGAAYAGDLSIAPQRDVVSRSEFRLPPSTAQPVNEASEGCTSDGARDEDADAPEADASLATGQVRNARGLGSSLSDTSAGGAVVPVVANDVPDRNEEESTPETPTVLPMTDVACDGESPRAEEHPEPTSEDPEAVGDFTSTGLTSAFAGAHSSADQPRRLEIAATDSFRPAIARWAAHLNGAEGRAVAHAALCLAEGLGSGTGAVAAALQALFPELGGDTLADRAAAHLTLAAALRAAVYSPSPDLIQLLTDLRSVYAHDDPTAGLLDEVVLAARAGAVVASASDAIHTAADLEDAVTRASEAARSELNTAPTRTNQYAAATRIWTTWVRRDGILGRLLVIASNDERESVENVAARIADLRNPRVLANEIRSADPRATKRNEIVAGARARLLDWAEQAVEIAGAWVDAVRAAASADLEGPIATGVLSRLRRSAQAYDWHSALDVSDPDELVAACARAAGSSISETIRLYRSGTDAGATEKSPDRLLIDDLLFSSGPLLSGSAPLSPPSLADLTTDLSADPDDPDSWLHAYEARASVDDHDSTARIVDALSTLDHVRGAQLSERRASDLERARLAADVECRQVRDLLASGRSHGHLDDADWSRLFGQIESLDATGRSDIAVVRHELREVREELSAAKHTALEGLEERLGALPGGVVSVPALERIRERITAEDIATAEEYLALSLDGLDLPEPPVETGVFEGWWPTVAAELESIVIDSRLAHAAETGTALGATSFGELDEASRREAASGLQAWTQLAAGRSAGRLIEALRPVLSLLGVEAKEAIAVQGQKGPDREWRQLVGFRPIGRPLVPDFGSQASGAATGDTLLLLIVWGAPRASTVASWIAQEQSSRPVMVWYLGALDQHERLTLADEFRASRARRPVVVVDDVAVAHLATIGGRDYESLMRLTLPFSAANPYQSVGGLTPVEMFYGRELERASLRDLTGSALVYGGRQLGKSSLLRATERDFDDGVARRALYLDLKAHQVGGTRPPDAIFEVLWTSLRPYGVLRDDPPSTQIDQRFKGELTRWLDERPGRALLVLLDEADIFLEADAETKFATVTSLKGVMDETGRRVKFVFAGLHKVQRFKSVENQPLAHLGSPIAVGPLRAPEAMNLVTRPLQALGYEFENRELPSRILAFCNSNPSLLVLFMQALLNRVLDQPLRRPGPGRPPVVITDADVEATYAKDSVAERIRERFELTLDLDPAYKVIAYSVAHEARERGEGVELTSRELRSLATGWWPKGFGDVSSDGFRALCDELADLGVLAYRHGNYGLRSPNILRFLGSADQIAEVLVDAENIEPSSSFEATSARSRLAGKRDYRSPLTAAQVSDLLAPRNQVRLVLGSLLMGIDRVAEALRTLAGPQIIVEEPDPSTTQLKQFKNSSGRHRVLLIDLDGVELDRAVRLVWDATVRPSSRGTLGIVFVASPRQLGLWRRAALGGEPWDRLGTISLGPVDPAAWRYWIIDGELPFADDAGAAELLARSGGWLELLELAAVTSRSDGRSAAMDELDKIESDEKQRSTVLERAGMTGKLVHVFRSICDYCSGGDTRANVVEAAVLAEGDETDVEVLRYLGVLRETGAEMLVPDAFTAAATAHLR